MERKQMGDGQQSGTAFGGFSQEWKHTSWHQLSACASLSTCSSAYNKQHKEGCLMQATDSQTIMLSLSRGCLLCGESLGTQGWKFVRTLYISHSRIVNSNCSKTWSHSFNEAKGARRRFYIVRGEEQFEFQMTDLLGFGLVSIILEA